jgi:hypothetical protein
MDAGLSAVERAVLDTAITATYTRAGITDDPSALAQLPDATAPRSWSALIPPAAPATSSPTSADCGRSR